MSVNTDTASTPAAANQTYIPQEFALDGQTVTLYQPFGLGIQYATVTMGDWDSETDSVDFTVQLMVGSDTDNATSHQGKLSTADYSVAVRALLGHQDVQRSALALYDQDPSANSSAKIVGMLFGAGQIFVPFAEAFTLVSDESDKPDADTREG